MRWSHTHTHTDMQGTPHFVPTSIESLVNFLIMADAYCMSLQQQGFPKTHCESKELWGAILMSLHLCVCMCVCVGSAYIITHLSHISLPHTASIMVKGTKWPYNVSITLLCVHIDIHVHTLNHIIIRIIPVPQSTIIHTLMDFLFWTWRFSAASRSQKWDKTLHCRLNWDVTLMCLCIENQLPEMRKVTETAASLIFLGIRSIYWFNRTQ